MKALGTILLAGALALGASAALAQVKLGGHGSAGAYGHNGSARVGAGANVRSRGGGGRIGVGGQARGSGGFSSGIGNSRVNSAISGQNRARSRARSR
jgi:hypothetical protein